MERDLLDHFVKLKSDDKIIDSKMKLEKVRILERKFEEDFARYKQSLIDTRNSIWEKNQKDYEAQLERLEKDRDILNEKLDEDLISQMKEFFDKKTAKLKLQIQHLTNNS